jgi:hypothetical protein
MYVTGINPATGDPCDYVIIEYDMIQCGPDIGIMFRSATFVSEAPCNRYSGTTPSSTMQSDYRDAQQAALQSVGATASNMSFVYPAGCQTIAEVSYPRGAKCYYFVPEGPNQGQVSGIVDLGTQPVLELIECPGSNCCKLDYAYDVNTGRYTLLNFDPIQPCDDPPPAITTKRFQCLDAKGNPVTYTGTVKMSGRCESYCNAALNTMFKTSGTNDFEPLPDPLDFTLGPVPATDYVSFSTTKTIERIEVYDVTGRKVIEQSVFDDDRIDIQSLEKGIHFVRVYFTDTGIRSIKIIKQ